MGKEIELGVASDFRVGNKKLSKLGVVAVDVVLVGKQRRIAGDDGGESRAQLEQFDQLLLRGGKIVVADGCSLRHRLSLRNGACRQRLAGGWHWGVLRNG